MISTIFNCQIDISFLPVRFLMVIAPFCILSNTMRGLFSMHTQEHKIVFAHKTNINYTYPNNTL